MSNKEEKKVGCSMCGKKLPAQYMFKEIKKYNKTSYICCQICYEQFSGKHISGNPDIEYK